MVGMSAVVDDFVYDLSFGEGELGALRERIALVAAQALRFSLVRCQDTHVPRADLERYASEIEAVVGRGDVERAQAMFAAESVGMSAQQGGSFVGQGQVVAALNWCVALIVMLDRPNESLVRDQLEWAVRVWGESVLK